MAIDNSWGLHECGVLVLMQVSCPLLAYKTNHYSHTANVTSTVGLVSDSQGCS